jgi:hypothetical protein
MNRTPQRTLIAFTAVFLLAPPVAFQAAEAARTADPEFPPELVEFGPASEKPLLAGTGTNTWDRKMRERGWFMREEGQWHLWFTGYNDDLTDARFLGYATSPDGIHWTRWPGNPLTTDGWVEDMCVVKRGDTWWLFYERRDLAVYVATSRDLAMGPETYDRHAVAVDQIIKHKGRCYAYYHASELPKWGEWSTCLAMSKDLVHWKKYPGNPVLPVNPAMPGAGSGTVVHDGQGYRLYTTHPDVRVYLPEHETPAPKP